MDTKDGVDPFFTRESLQLTSAMYLAGQDPHQELVSPALFGDLTGFPPMLLQVGTNEVLLDDSTRMAARARAAGVDVILDVTADVPHVFQAFTGVLDEADNALDRAALFLAQHVRTVESRKSSRCTRSCARHSPHGDASQGAGLLASSPETATPR
ncbi:alpha/beta hydrolase fold domain-containing protein [Kibdelosporangium lantanae]|uniref:Alpha/beta hydrolase fold domain-containing protein n=1 Tax=Kibdelosporangium lantanae TaxID=1497396 RepID=A0ABW3M530_9PSEU